MIREILEKSWATIRLIKGRSRWVVIWKGDPFADQRSTRGTKRASERGVDRGPGYNKLTHKGPPVINTRRTRGSDCINWRRKRKKSGPHGARARSEFKAGPVCVGVCAFAIEKCLSPLGLLACPPQKDQRWSPPLLGSDFFPPPSFEYVSNNRFIRE